MDRPAFYDAIRHAPFSGLNGSQVSGIEAILDAAPEGLLAESLAYCLATTFHETARTMRPIEEYGRGKGRAYGLADPQTGKVYYGRGLVQLTWRANYDRAGRAVMADLVNHPEMALDATLAAEILFRGMAEGWFTGKKLSDYFGSGKADPVGARRIINGTDKAEMIAGYHSQFLSALVAAGRVEVATATVPVVPRPAPAVPAPLPPAPVVKVSWLGRVLAGLKGA